MAAKQKFSWNSS